MVNIEMAKETIKADLKLSVNQLLVNAESLKAKMENLIERIEKDGENVSLCSYGEIQNRGIEIDVLCGKIHAYQKAIELFK